MHILITGASKGIGLEIAKLFALRETSLRCSICSRSDSEIEKASAQLKSLRPEITSYASVCDVSKEDQVEAFVRSAQEALGPVDILVNNAGFGIFKPIVEFTSDEFESVIATNVRGVFLMTKAVLPSMIEKNRGTIVTIGSLAGKNGFAGGAAYCASKFAVRGMMQSVFLEVREHNIRCVTLFPGSVETDFFIDPNRTGSLKSKQALQPEDIAEVVYFASTMPPNADISELDIRPTNPKGS